MASLSSVIAFFQQGRLQEAAAAVDEILAQDPTNALALNVAGAIVMTAGNAENAEALWRAAIAYNPNLPEAHNNLGALLHDSGRFADAETTLQAALAIQDTNSAAHYNLGRVYMAQAKLDEAEKSFQRALALRPDYPEALINLGLTARDRGQFEQAEQALREALRLAPDYREARWNLALVLLARGNYAEGWPLYDTRDQLPPGARPPDPDGFTASEWHGEPLNGKSIIVLREQGLGDEIMCARFAAALAARGASRVTWTCRPELRVLFDGVIGANEVASVREGESPDVGQHDVWAHMLSVARYLCPSPDSIPSALPYLRPDAARFAKWRGHLNAGGRKIGLVWKGGAQHPNDAHRSLPSLTALQPLWSVPDVTFYALQKGRDENLATPMSQPMVNLGPKLSDFADTAAVIAQLDLVISIDTAVAHLAGALGKPCWILVPAINPDWRWIAGRDDTPWYPDAVRLFRQAKPGDWVQPVQCMAAELAGFVRRP